MRLGRSLERGRTQNFLRSGLSRDSRAMREMFDVIFSLEVELEIQIDDNGIDQWAFESAGGQKF